MAGRRATGLLLFAERDLPDVVYMEQLNSALYQNKPDVVGRYLAVFERLRTDALNPACSVEALQAMLP